MAYLRMARPWDVKKAYYFPLCVCSRTRMISLLVCWSFNLGGRTDPWPSPSTSTVPWDQLSSPVSGRSHSHPKWFKVIRVSRSLKHRGKSSHGSSPSVFLILHRVGRIPTQQRSQYSFSHTSYYLYLKVKNMSVVVIHESEVFTF